MNAQKDKNNIIEDLMESEEDASPVADLKRITIRKFNELEQELKENIQKNSTNFKRT
jgi:hypothetical protein